MDWLLSQNISLFEKYVVFSKNLSKLLLPYLYCIGSWKILKKNKKKNGGELVAHKLYIVPTISQSYDLSNTAYKNNENLKLLSETQCLFIAENYFSGERY